MQNSYSNVNTLGQTRMLWRRRRVLALATFFTVFVSLATLVASLPDLYRSKATVMVNQGEVPSIPGAPPAPGELDARLDALTQEVESRQRLQDLITRYDLYRQMRKSASPEAVIAQMRKDIRFDRQVNLDQWGRGTTVSFTVSYQGVDPQTVAQVTNALATGYVQGNESLTHSEAAGNASSLEAQLNNITAKLHAQQQQIDQFKNGHLGELPEQQGANLATLEQLNAQLHMNSENQIRAMETRVELLKQMTETGNPDLSALQQQLASLRTKYTDSYPDVVRLKAQIATLEHAQGPHPTAASADASSEQLRQVDAELNSLKSEEAQLRSDIASYQSRVENVPKREQELQALMQGYDETKGLYSTLLKQYEEAQLGQSPQSPSVNPLQILDPAVAPREPAGPNRLRLMLMALLLALGASAAGVFLAEQLDTSFHTVEELRSFTRLPVLAVIPAVVTHGDIWRRRLGVGAATLSALVAIALVAWLSYAIGADNEQLLRLLTPQAVS